MERRDRDHKMTCNENIREIFESCYEIFCYDLLSVKCSSFFPSGGDPDDSGLGDDYDSVNPDDLLYPLQKLEKYMDSENIFSRWDNLFCFCTRLSRKAFHIRQQPLRIVWKCSYLLLKVEGRTSVVKSFIVLIIASEQANKFGIQWFLTSIQIKQSAKASELMDLTMECHNRFVNCHSVQHISSKLSKTQEVQLLKMT